MRDRSLLDRMVSRTRVSGLFKNDSTKLVLAVLPCLDTLGSIRKMTYIILYNTKNTFMKTQHGMLYLQNTVVLGRSTFNDKITPR